jgi:type VI secretion system secreted protein Hcp
MASPLYATIYDQNNTLIEGPVNIKGREKTFEIISANHEINLPADTDNGAILGNRMHSPFHINKLLDAGSPVLKKILCDGAALKKVNIDFYRTADTGKEERYYSITLHDARVTYASLFVNDTKKEENKTLGHRETYGFIYGKITETYLPDNMQYSDEWKDRG